MSIEVFVADEQAEEPVDCARWGQLAKEAVRAQKVRGEVELSLLFVDSTTIAALNERFLGHKGPTDVLSFPIEDEVGVAGRSPDGGGNGPGWEPPEGGELPTLLGDIVICPAVARANAPNHAGTYEDELALLVVHGLLHLLGMDHEDPAQADVMEAREQELLEAHHRRNGEAEGAMILAATLHLADVGILVAVIVLLGFAAMLALAETGLVRTSRARARALEAEGRRGAKSLSRLVDNPEGFLAPVLLLVLICQLVAATLVGVEASRIFGALGVAIATIFEVVVIFIAGEAVPKHWAISHADRAALFAAPFVSAVIAFPPFRIVSSLLIGLARLVTPGGNAAYSEPEVTESELLALADFAVAEDVIEHDERALISSIIEFGDTIVREVMAPRPDIVAVEASATIGSVLERTIARGLSRIPVYAQTVDDIVGIAFARDLIRAVRDAKEDRPVSEICRPAHYVPETKRVAALLRQMQSQQFHLAVVVDEYGGTAGIVTLEDLIEELIGEIADEFDIDEPLVEPISDTEFRVSGKTPVDEVNELLGADLPVDDDWDTIAGLLLHLHGHVPAPGEALEAAGLLLVAERVQGRRIGSVRIVRLEHPNESPLGQRAATPADERR